MDKVLIKKSTMITKNTQPVEDVYEVDQKTLGSGTYGVVKKAIHKKTKQVRAVKVIARKKIKNWERFLTEVKILQTLDHPNIIKLYEYFEDDKNVYLVTEMCTGGELFDKIIEKEYFDEAYASKIFKQILNAINYCHKLDIAHRDLKPENFLYESTQENSEIKVIDFGLSKICHTKNTGKIERLKTKAGTPYYISPEVLAGNYDKQCDLWSAGCILYILLCGYPPFYGEDDQEILRAVQKGVFDFNGEEWDDVSKEAKDLIKKLITKPERRLTA
jgi:calcium-dependent protein kinase